MNTAPADVGPLTIRCTYCAAPAGVVCLKDDGSGRMSVPARRTHKDRIRLAYAAVAHADPALDAWPQLGPVTDCLLCSSGLPQRHRMVDAIADRMSGGEFSEDIVADYVTIPIAAVEAVEAWSRRWPGATR